MSSHHFFNFSSITVKDYVFQLSNARLQQKIQSCIERILNFIFLTMLVYISCLPKIEAQDFGDFVLNFLVTRWSCLAVWFSVTRAGKGIKKFSISCDPLSHRSTIRFFRE